MIFDYSFRVVLLGVCLLSASAGVIGCFAVLRRRSLTGDALAHAALPGVCIAFLLAGSQRNLLAMLAGALAFGLLGVLVITALRRFTRIKEDAAIGIVLGVFFGAGIYLLRVIQKMPGGYASGLNTYILGQTAGITQQDIQIISSLALATLVLMLLFFKEFKLVAFDPSFARVQGWPTTLLDLVLMTLIAIAVVIGLPAVGVVMMAALLIMPAAVARFWTERLHVMLLLAPVAGVVMGAVGTMLSASFRFMPAGPSIILAGAALFTLSAMVAPQRGIVARLARHLRFQRDVRLRKLLRLAFELIEPQLPSVPLVSVEKLAEKSRSDRATTLRQLRAAERNQLLRFQADGRFQLTEKGLRRARGAARIYHLWELFLEERPELASTYVNWHIEPPEDSLPPSLIEELEPKLPLALRQRDERPRSGGSAPNRITEVAV